MQRPKREIDWFARGVMAFSLLCLLLFAALVVGAWRLALWL